jgi:glycosyltransferase involved in cell wall biosynthesis
MIKVIHVMDRFNPMLGQEINVLSKNKSPEIDLTILTSTSLSTWNITDPEKVAKLDRDYQEKHGITIIRKPIVAGKGEKMWVKGIAKEIRKIDPDIVYCHGIEYISFFRLLLQPGFTKRYLLVTDTHSLPRFTQGSRFRKIYYTLLRKIIIPVVNRKRITTFYTADENRLMLSEIYRVDTELLNPFLIGADTTTFSFDAAARTRIRGELGLKDNDFCILFTGRLCEAKAPHLIPLSLKQGFEGTDLKVVLVFIGFQDTEYMKQHEQDFVPDRNVTVKFISPIPAAQLREYYSSADVAVFPAESTLSSLEAQACKLPVIMEDNETNRIRCQAGGLLFNPRDLAGLRGAINKLHEDPVLRKTLAQDGFEYVISKFDYIRNVRNMESIISNQYLKRKSHVRKH